LTEVTAPITPDGRLVSLVRQISFQEPVPTVEPPPFEPAAADAAIEIGLAATPDAGTPAAGVSDTNMSDAGTSNVLMLRVVPIPEQTWESLPPSCLMRMFEFDSIRQEYERTFSHQPPADQRDQSQRLALEDILELALINSREYQTQKETLYEVALRLTLERFEYDMKFAVGGNGTAVVYLHNRFNSTTVDNLTVPSTITGGKVLATGGDLLARFANEVVLTFNGPRGFAADIGSDVLLNISQSVFQRDIVLEPLTQAERNLVYAARDFARFRKELFSRLAADYYGLVLAYRGIEIDAQDYFSNTRAFHQGKAEYRYEGLPRLQVDQFEQTALASRSRLIGSCNSLEDDLDRLKLQIGLPTEMPINLDLTELEELTLRDESTVAGERVRRARDNLLWNRSQRDADRSVLLNDAIDLTERMLALTELRDRLGHQELETGPLRLLLAQLSAEETRLLVESNRGFLLQDQQSTPPAPPLRIFQRTMDLVGSLLTLSRRQIELAVLQSADPTATTAVRKDWQAATTRAEQITSDIETAVTDRRLDRIPELRTDAETLLAEVEVVAQSADALTDSAVRTPEQTAQETQQRIDRLLDESEKLLARQNAGMVPVELNMDEAMLTALVRRFDIMNERGALADTWRRIKLAGDDLKSVLNLNATQTIRTKANRPFGFTFDESQTRLSMTLDTPLNRKAQSNAFRVSLIDYQAGLRHLMELEDGVKLSVRSDLRSLQLRREQYRIAVASAALANDRVHSTRLQLQLGIEGVTARDFLEAQQAYTASLSAVAGEHIDYLLNRIELFMDLELLEVDQDGFWPELYNEQLQPTPCLHLPAYARPAYGTLPDRVCHSHKIERMLNVPTGHTEIYKDQPAIESGTETGGETAPQ
ncbi:MAG TPA: TolC family protein, partial [Thermoguttaceae bacterium]|nr:TolC family protein [Thermoguttaceae bacterium]